MNKSLKSIMFLAMSVFALSIFCAADDFESIKIYKANDFLDVADSEWYYDDVVSAYNMGFVNGVGENFFDPNGNVTAAQGITVAARLCSIYNSDSHAFAESAVWYQPYVDYAKANGFLADGDFSDYDAPIKRSEMIILLADALPSECYTAINNIQVIPDVNSAEPYFTKLLTLYNAGIVMGNDDFGTFEPQSGLKRSELCAIINRIALPKNRIAKALRPTGARTYGDAYFIFDEKGFSGKVGIPAGWIYDNRGSLFSSNTRYPSGIFDSNAESEYSYIKRFEPESDGILSFNASLRVGISSGGIYFHFSDAAGNIPVKVTLENSEFTLIGATQTTIETGYTGGDVVVRLDMDLDNNTATLSVDGERSDSVSLAPHNGIEQITLGTTESGIVTLSPLQLALGKNMPVFEEFWVSEQKQLIPGDFEQSGFSVRKTEGNSGYDVYSLYTKALAQTKSYVKKSFEPMYGNVVFQSMVLLPNAQSGAYISLKNDDVEIVKILTKDNDFILPDNTLLRTFRNNIWQTIRIEADTNTQKAIIRIDGKHVGTYDFLTSTQSFNNIELGVSPSADCEMWVDDLWVFNLVEHDDYPPEPVPAVSANHNVGVHTCNLWRGSNSGEGWDSVSPFEELTPYLGYYDEGLIEVADWETKWMVEHGIDFQHLCWYSPSADIKNPIKKSNLNDHLHDAYFNGKYSDMLDFCFMWENTGRNVNSLAQFQEYLWPYWCEYYFSDPRYLVLDNKPVMTVWSYGRYVEAFGGTTELALAGTNFMKEAAKQMGYDGFILMFADGHQMSEDYFNKVKSIGADATYGYHWQRTGKDASHQIYRMSTQQNMQIIHNVPTVSVGFNDIGRNDIRTDLITVEGHKGVCEYIRDTYLPYYHTNTWKDNTLFVSTWNEFSEGTYVAPASIHGFDYLDNVRETFTNASAHTDEIPTEAQVKRVTHMYRVDHTPIRWLRYEKTDIVEPLPNFETSLSWDMSDINDSLCWFNFFGLSSFSNYQGMLAGTGQGIDYAVRTNLDTPLSIKYSTYIHLRMKANVDNANAEIFFITDTDQTWNGDKYISVRLGEKNKFVDYYIDMSQCALWRGYLTSLRIDPITAPGSFEISLIEILVPSENDENVLCAYSNMTKMAFDFALQKTSDGDVLATADPQCGFFSMLGLYHEYNRFTGKLIMKSRRHTVELNVGSDKMLVDGIETDFGRVFSLRDGLPILPLKKLCDTFGYTNEWYDEYKFYMYTLSDEFIEILKSRKPYEWEWHIDGDDESWTFQNTTPISVSGSIGGEALSNNTGAFDPAVISPRFSVNTRDYKKVIVGITYNITGTPNSREIIQLFYNTGNDEYFTGAKNYALYLSSGRVTDENIIEFTFDMTNVTSWIGPLTQIRIDPFNNKGNYRVHYVRLAQ